MMYHNYEKRQQQILLTLKSEKLDALFISNKENLLYLSGYSGDDAWGFVSNYGNFLYTDFRNLERAEKEIKGFTVCDIERSLFDALKINIRKIRKMRKRIGIESMSMTVDFFNRLSAKIAAEYTPTRNIVENLRICKDEYEIKLIQDAANIVADTSNSIAGWLKNNKVITEIDINDKILQLVKEKGASGTSFSTIVAPGKKSAMPHPPEPKNKKIEDNPLLIDFGARFKGYCSDLTRTIILDKIPTLNYNLLEIYTIVLAAQEKAISMIAPGLPACSIDAEARKIISNAGYGDFFGHALGHGIGLQVHELPRISAFSEEILKPGMVFSVEPGIYLPEKGGVRIEDMVLVTDDGCKILTEKAKKQEGEHNGFHK